MRPDNQTYIFKLYLIDSFLLFPTWIVHYTNRILDNNKTSESKKKKMRKYKNRIHKCTNLKLSLVLECEVISYNFSFLIQVLSSEKMYIYLRINQYDFQCSWPEQKVLQYITP